MGISRIPVGGGRPRNDFIDRTEADFLWMIDFASRRSNFLRMMVDSELLDALHLVQTNEVAQRIFETVSGKLGISGWELAKTVNQAPEKTNEVLQQFTDKGIFRTPTPGLEGNYSLSGLGFTLKEQLSGGRFSR